MHCKNLGHVHVTSFASEKMKAMERAGIHVTENPAELGTTLENIL